MRILLIGNIGTGKTTLGRSLSREMEIELHTIDDYRKRFSDGSYSGEYFAQANFLKTMESSQEGIYEFTGVGIHKHAVRYCLSGTDDAVAIVRVLVKDKSNRARIADKEWNVPYPFKMDLEEHMNYIDRELAEDKESDFWDIEGRETHILEIDNTEDKAHERLAKELAQKISELVRQ
ncbi:MAG: AAA family ATPase [Candidatus Thorarchaeota archaeon]|jgi:adenylate kinase family enzyme